MTYVPKLPEIPIKAGNAIFQFDTKIKHRRTCKILYNTDLVENHQTA
jgi:hypothetical protein